MQAIERLKKMIGNVYQYEGGKITIHDVEELETFGLLKTDSGDVRISLSDIDSELEFFQLLKNNELARNPTVISIISQSSGMYSKLQDTLLSTIDKIEKDSSYIPQAQAINETIKSVIDLEKVKVQTLQLLK